MLSVVGIGVAFWIIKNDSEEDPVNAAPESSPEVTQRPAAAPSKPSPLSKLTSFKEKFSKSTDTASKPKKSTSLLSGLLSKINPGKNKPDETTSQTTPTPNLREYLSSEKKEADKILPDAENASSEQAPLGSAGILATPTESVDEEKTLSKEEEGNIEKEIKLSSELSELKAKHDKLEALFNEKSTEYEKSKESLNNELENRKEFNKVKDLLEKELKDSKDKAHEIQEELNTAQTENENQKKRNAQLEEKTGKLEKELLQKEDKINDLVKRMQTFGSPTTAQRPPVMEEKQQGSNVEETSKADPAPAEQGPLDQPPEKQPQDDPPEKSDPEKTTHPPEESPQSENTLSPTRLQNAMTPQEEALSQSVKKLPEPKKTETEVPQIDEEEKKPKEQSLEEGSTQKGGFTLNLSIDQEPPATEEPEKEEPEEEEFLKLQPDVLSGDPQETDNIKTPDEPPQSPPEDASDNQKPNS